MSRKLILALAAGAALTAAAPLSASAHWDHGGHDGWRGGWGHHHQHGGYYFAPPPRVFSPPAYAGYDRCMRRRFVPTPWGWRPRWVNVCTY